MRYEIEVGKATKVVDQWSLYTFDVCHVIRYASPLLVSLESGCSSGNKVHPDGFNRLRAGIKETEMFEHSCNNSHHERPSEAIADQERTKIGQRAMPRINTIRSATILLCYTVADIEHLLEWQTNSRIEPIVM